MVLLTVSKTIMTEVSKINSAIRSFLAKNESLKSLPKGKILSIMVMQGIISHADASEYLKNSTFDTGYTSNFQVIPQWEGDKKAFDESLGVLNSALMSVRQQLANQDNSEGIVSKAVNYFKEVFETDNKRSDMTAGIEDTQRVVSELEKSSSPEEFKARFKDFLGVEFSASKIRDCKEKAEIFNKAASIKSTVDGLKSGLKTTSFNDLNSSITGAFSLLGIKDIDEVNKILQSIEAEHKDNPAIKDFGGDLRFEKNYYGQYTLRMTNKNGRPALANTLQLQMVAEEMLLRLNKAEAAAMGVEVPEKASNKDIEQLIEQKYDKVKSEYKNSFKEAYGNKNIETMAEDYINSQKQNTAYVQTALDAASIATMFMGGGVVLKGVSLLTKSGKVLKTVQAATNIAAKAAPAAVAVQVTRPVDLAENLTSQEPDWKAYGMSVAEGAMWMALGMATGAVGDKARMFLGQKGLSSVAKNTGKSIDELIGLYKSGHKLPANLNKSLGLIENASKISGTGAEFTADILATYAIQKGRGEDLTFMDYLGSANGALMGTVMHKTFAKISDAEKVKVIQKGLIESNPDMSKAELEKASQMLLDVHRLAEEKRTETISKPETVSKPAEAEKFGEVKSAENVKKVDDIPETVLVKEGFDKDGKKILLLNEAGEAKVRASADEIHTKAVKAESGILQLMKYAGLGEAGVNMTHRPKSAQSLYDKIRNAMTDVKSPATFDEALKSVRDAVGTRTELGDFDYKKHPDIVEMYKKDPKKAIQMAAERQSEEYVQKVMNVIKMQAKNPTDAPLSAINISNYMGKDGIPYFSAKQVAVLRDYAAQFGIELNVKDKLTKVRASGYTALQMNFVTKDGFTFEWQLRGSKVNTFAECEHVPYDIREGKDVTGGKKILERLYAPIKDAVEHLDDKQYEKYNNYLTAHYEHLRKQELGFESTAPVLEDFGLNDPKLKAENLELLHDLADALKKGKIDENTALYTYLSKTENKSGINIPPGRFAAENAKFPETDEAFVNIIKNRKEDFLTLSKIEDTDEFIRKGAELILSEMGLEGAPIKIEITDNLNEFSMSEATLRISRNWTGSGHVAGKGDRAEILGGIAHEMNHFLQNKEIYLNAMLRSDDFKYNLELTDECENLMLWSLGADDAGSAKFPYPLEQPDYNFDRANKYMENFLNYVEPYKMEEIDGKKVYVKDENGNYVIDDEAFEAYQRQLVEAESNRRGDIVKDEYKKLINGQ